MAAELPAIHASHLRTALLTPGSSAPGSWESLRTSPSGEEFCASSACATAEGGPDRKLRDGGRRAFCVEREWTPPARRRLALPCALSYSASWSDRSTAFSWGYARSAWLA